MAITTLSKIRISCVYNLANNVGMNTFDYNVLEIIGTPTADHYAQAWWNHVKTNYRALVGSSFGAVLMSVKVNELGNSVGEYGEYAIPLAEQTGTRSAPSDTTPAPVFNAAGVRLTVGTRLTRPGQKRFPFLYRDDLNSQVIASTYATPLNTLMTTLTANMTLGAPAAGVVLVPHVVGLNPDGSIRQSQLVTGFLANPNVTSQVSRKVGRGI